MAIDISNMLNRYNETTHCIGCIYFSFLFLVLPYIDSPSIIIFSKKVSLNDKFIQLLNETKILQLLGLPNNFKEICHHI